jgi:hypothetical protein
MAGTMVGRAHQSPAFAFAWAITVGRNSSWSEQDTRALTTRRRADQSHPPLLQRALVKLAPLGAASGAIFVDNPLRKRGARKLRLSPGFGRLPVPPSA